MPDTFPPFLKWGQYKSTDLNKPDILELKVKDTEVFETTYSINVVVWQKTDDAWQECILPLKSHESKNSSLLDQWNKATSQKNIKKEKDFKIKTWLGQSKFGRSIRRFSLEI